MSPAFTPAAYCTAIERESDAFQRAVDGNLGAPVPSCPDWDVADLTWHLTAVHEFWRKIAAGRLQSPSGMQRDERPAQADLLTHYIEGARFLVETLRAADPAREVWTWSSQKNVAFIQRRMAQETCVHRYDAQLAAKDPQPIDAPTAADGVDEFLEFFLPYARRKATGRGSVHLHSTDSDGEWIIRLDGKDVTFDHGHEKADVAVRATASDLNLLLWRRVPPEDVEVLGDRSVLDELLAHAAIE